MLNDDPDNPVHPAKGDGFRPTGAPPLYAQDGKGYDATVHAHYFVGSCDWLVTEYDPVEDIAFGWACLGDRQMAELGYVSMAELQEVKVPLRVRTLPDGQEQVGGLIRVELDTGWPDGLTLAQAIEVLDRRQGRG